jgi:hypothetical protein
MRQIKNYASVALTVLFLGPVFLLSGLGAKVVDGNKPDGLMVLLGMTGTAAQIAVLYWIANRH